MQVLALSLDLSMVDKFSGIIIASHACYAPKCSAMEINLHHTFPS